MLAAILGLGGLSFLLPESLWRPRSLEVRITSQLLFVVLTGGFLGSVYWIWLESELWKLRLLTLQLVLAAQSEHSASMFDSVTNVFTRSFLHELLQREIARAERNNRPLGLVMCDLDNFKEVNDRYGHLMGDEMLARVAAILKDCVRGSDHVVRYGGDEFLLILPETDEAGAQIVQRRIREKVLDLGRGHRLRDLQISVSMGMHLHVSGQSAERDIAEADARMYREKQAAQSLAPAPTGAAQKAAAAIASSNRRR